MGFSNSNDPDMADSFSTKKLRPLTPRPAITATTTTCSSTTSSPYTTPTHGSGDYFPSQDHFGAPEQGKRQLSDHQVSSRWNPTPEQLQVLEDLYRRGIHTPTAEQIRNITALLRRCGKIEGKNVFYWFQNHKARERQKRRRQTEESVVRGTQCNVEILERKESDSTGRGFQGEGCKSWLSATNCNINVEEPVSTYRADWLHQHQSMRDIHATWHVGSLSSPPHLMNINCNSNPSIAAATVTATLSKPKIPINGDYSVDDEEWGQSQTLDLFPVRSDGSIFEEKTQAPATPPMMTLSPCHFFEFL